MQCGGVTETFSHDRRVWWWMHSPVPAAARVGPAGFALGREGQHPVYRPDPSLEYRGCASRAKAAAVLVGAGFEPAGGRSHTDVGVVALRTQSVARGRALSHSCLPSTTRRSGCPANSHGLDSHPGPSPGQCPCLGTGGTRSRVRSHSPFPASSCRTRPGPSWGLSAPVCAPETTRPGPHHPVPGLS